jgi:hypothetical protein
MRKIPLDLGIDLDKNTVLNVYYFSTRRNLHVFAAKQDFVQNQRVKNMTCEECNHTKGECECLCCCSISKIGCSTCIIPVLVYRGIKKIIRKSKTK